MERLGGGGRTAKINNVNQATPREALGGQTNWAIRPQTKASRPLEMQNVQPAIQTLGINQGKKRGGEGARWRAIRPKRRGKNRRLFSGKEKGVRGKWQGNKCHQGK